MSDVQPGGSAARSNPVPPADAARAAGPRPTLSIADCSRDDVQEPGARPTLLSARGVKKSYRKANVEIPVLRGVDLDVSQGEFLSIIGQSGSGKSTLLHVCATLDQADSGEILFAGERIDQWSRARRDTLRNRRFGMIFQF
ncbi:MAG TPA: ATP-binding cassette domain-containing protein, partial [Pirellulales bacterium]|nr:ATP-binding cassette domain-containing protein [Pirellulales bacterium]